MKKFIFVLIVCIGISVNYTTAEIYSTHADAWYKGEIDRHNSQSMHRDYDPVRTYFVYLDAYTTANSDGYSQASAYLYKDFGSSVEYHLEATGGNSHPTALYVTISTWANSVAVVAEAHAPTGNVFSYASAQVSW